MQQLSDGTIINGSNLTHLAQSRHPAQAALAPRLLEQFLMTSCMHVIMHYDVMDSNDTDWTSLSAIICGNT